MDEADTQKDDPTIPLQINLRYVNAAQDACFRWLQRKYYNIKPVFETRPAGSTGEELHINSTLLNHLENDVAACDDLRWRVFSFPSHPTKPLHESYRHISGRKGGTSSTIVDLRPTHQRPSDQASDAVPLTKDRYTLVIRTREDRDATKRSNKNTYKAEDLCAAAAEPASVVTVPNVEALLEKAVQESKQAHWCRILGEEDVKHDIGGTPGWTSWWIPRTWRPLLGGYISAPSRADHARFLIFPQSEHCNAEGTHAKSLHHADGISLNSPQSVPYYLRGSAHCVVEESNPAVGTATQARSHHHHQPSDTVSTRGGLHYGLTYAHINPAPSLGHRNWADLVELSAAHQQARTERQYIPEKAKVQRLSLLEDSVALKTSQGDPRYSTLIAATRATVLNSSIARQKPQCPSAASKEELHKIKSSVVPDNDDVVLQLRVEDVYDSSVQHFTLPNILQRWQRPVVTTAPTMESGEVVSSKSLGGTRRGLYRLRYSGGPGVELCRVGGDSDVGSSATSPHAPESVVTIFGKLWSESWLQVPLASRWRLTLRNQTAISVPLDLNETMTPPTAAGVLVETNTSARRLRTHPYFWATQGPRWDAALVRGFKNDYSGLHHARRWYSIFSAELAFEGGNHRSNNRCRKKIRGDAASQPSRKNDSRDRRSNSEVEMAEGYREHSTSTAGKWGSGTSLTAFANACIADTLRDYPRASVGISFVSRMPRLSITPFNEILPHHFECSLNWFATLRPNTGDAKGGNNGQGSTGLGLELRSGLSETGPSALSPTIKDDNMPLFRVSPVEMFQHLKCGLTWRFDD